MNAIGMPRRLTRAEQPGDASLRRRRANQEEKVKRGRRREGGENILPSLEVLCQPGHEVGFHQKGTGEPLGFSPEGVTVGSLGTQLRLPASDGLTPQLVPHHGPPLRFLPNELLNAHL